MFPRLSRFVAPVRQLAQTTALRHLWVSPEVKAELGRLSWMDGLLKDGRLFADGAFLSGFFSKPLTPEGKQGVTEVTEKHLHVSASEIVADAVLDTEPKQKRKGLMHVLPDQYSGGIAAAIRKRELDSLLNVWVKTEIYDTMFPSWNEGGFDVLPARVRAKDIQLSGNFDASQINFPQTVGADMNYKGKDYTKLTREDVRRLPHTTRETLQKYQRKLLEVRQDKSDKGARWER